MESVEWPHNQFKYPILEEERDEFQRVSEELKSQGIDVSVEDLLSAAENGALQFLNEHLWEQLYNSESFSIDRGDWERVAAIANENGKDWQTPKRAMESYKALSAPIVMKRGERYDLVSGNTRLLVSRALGITPRVLMFEVGGR